MRGKAVSKRGIRLAIPAGKAIMLPLINAECDYSQKPNLKIEQQLQTPVYKNTQICYSKCEQNRTDVTIRSMIVKWAE
jgi:hypothetical protein